MSLYDRTVPEHEETVVCGLNRRQKHAAAAVVVGGGSHHYQGNRHHRHGGDASVVNSSAVHGGGGFNVSPYPRRRLSLHSSLVVVAAQSDSSPPKTRRFSNVSDAVSRKFSHWRNTYIPTEEIVAQGKSLCGQYMRNRLKRSGFFNKKLGLQRLRSVIGTTAGATVREVLPRLVGVGVELERMNPKVYSNVARQSGRPVLINEKTVRSVIVTVGREIIKSELTWGKVVSIFAVAGGLGVDCVKQGRLEFLNKIVEGVEELLEDELAAWVASNGGWTALSAHFKPPEPELTVFEIIGLMITLSALVLLLAFLLRWCGKTAFF